MTKKVIIIGGGIAGLSCAYDLQKAGFQVELYERNNVCGGQARSIKAGRCSNTYAWRIWATSYYNFLDISKQIPVGDKTVFDNFVALPSYSRKEGIGTGRNGDSLDGQPNPRKFKSKIEYARLILKILNMIMMSDERLRENDITFYDYIDPKEQATIDWVHEFVGPIIGMEAKRATLYCIAKGWPVTYVSMGLWNKFQGNTVYVVNAPYNDAIFTPWVKHLQEQGVKINVNTKITDITFDHKTNKISSITTDQQKVTGDEFVICLDQTAVNKLFSSKQKLMRIPMINKATQLMKYGNEMYFGMVLYFSEPFSVPLASGCAQDQPWKPVIQNFSAVWEDKYIKECDAAEILQVSCLNLVRGHNGKILADCSVEEILQEIFFELHNTEFLHNVTTKDGNSIWDSFIDYNVWPYWKTGADGKIYNTIDEYKLSINPKCWELMPNIKTPIDNMYFGSVIAKADTPMVSMEFACYNGRKAAQAISEKYNAVKSKVYNHPGILPTLLGPVRRLDGLFFKLGIKVNWVIAILWWAISLVIGLIILIIYGIRKIFSKK